MLEEVARIALQQVGRYFVLQHLTKAGSQAVLAGSAPEWRLGTGELAHMMLELAKMMMSMRTEGKKMLVAVHDCLDQKVAA